MDYSCGLKSFRPRWLQQFANTKCFIIVYSLLGTVQGMSYIYTSATLTTLEKRFKIPSRTIGVLMSGNEVSQVFLSLYMSYQGGKGNRPLWISWGVTFSAISCYILALPHIIYGPGTEALALTQEYLNISLLNSSLSFQVTEESALCTSNRIYRNKVCENQALFTGDTSLMPLIIIFFSQFVLGIGTTLFHSLGQTYLDDHTKKTSAPIMLGLVMSLRMVGPAAGFAFSSFCLSLYIDPTLTPVIGPQDPRWLGAWWLGWIVLGSLMLLFAFLIAWFPAELPSKNKRHSSLYKDSHLNKKKADNLNTENKDLLTSQFRDEEHKTSRINQKKAIEEKRKKFFEENDGFFESLRRLLANKLLLYNIFAGVFYIMGSSGSMTFSMKYMETQYHTSAAGASMISGSASVLAMVFGFLGSGYFIGRLKPQPRVVLGWNVVLGSVSVLGSVIYIFLGCKDNGLYGLDFKTGNLEIVNDCNSMCSCSNLKYQPVCYVEGDTTFYSACHIGCHSEVHLPNGSSVFTNCTCLPLPTLSNSNLKHHIHQPFTYSKNIHSAVENGPCTVDCRKILYFYVLVTFFINTLGSSGRIGNILVNFRCVKQKDKVFAQGLSLLILSLFAFIPGPIIFGAIIDTTCLLWDKSCGSNGNCWYYHKDKFRIYMNSMAAVLTSVGVLLDAKVWYLGKSLNLYGEPPDTSSSSKEIKFVNDE